MKRRMVVLCSVIVAFSFWIGLSFAETPAQKILIAEEAGGKLFLVTPPGGAAKDSILFLELNGSSYLLGYQHASLLADMIVDVMNNRYGCDRFPSGIQNWIEEAFSKMPSEFQEEIRGLADGLRAKGYNFPFWKVVIHAAQPIVNNNVGFPWFVCSWEEPADQRGSFSYALWGNYVAGGGTIAINSPDWGPVPRSLARHRVIISIRPDFGHGIVFPGVAGAIGMLGFNSVGVSVAGTAGQQPIKQMMAMPGNGVPIPANFTPGLLFLRNVLAHLRGNDPLLFEHFEEMLKRNPIDGFHIQISAPGRSAVWESGAAASPDYPRSARRMAGEWDDGHIIPVDWRGNFVLSQSGVFPISNFPFSVGVEFNDSNGIAYSGKVELSDGWHKWRRSRVGKAFILPPDPDRAHRFQTWFSNLGMPKPDGTPYAVSYDGPSTSSIVSVLSDKSGGWWVSVDGSQFGTWSRTSEFSFKVLDLNGSEICSGSLYDFGNGVAGWCVIGDAVVEWSAWTFQFPDDSSERSDGMNLSVLSSVAPFAQAYGDNMPHNRTMFVLREIGAPASAFTLESVFRAFQRAYLNTGQENNPFGVGAYDLENRNALFTVDRWENDQYFGGLNPFQIPIFLTRQQLFGW